MSTPAPRLREHPEPGAAYPYSIVYYRGVTADGSLNRHRVFFSTKKAAKYELSKLKKETRSTAPEDDQFTSEERAAVIFARGALAGLPGKGHLRRAIESYATRAKRAHATAKVADFVSDFLASQTGLARAERTLKDQRLRLARFVRAFGDRDLRSISAVEVQAWLDSLGLGPVSLRNYRRVLSRFFGAAVRRGLADENSVKLVETPRVIQGTPEVLTPQELRTMFGAADPRLLASLALGAFCGLREAEIARLRWSAVDLKSGHVVLTQAETKTRRRRLVPLPENAKAWLEKSPNKEGAIQPANVRWLTEAARRAAGFGPPGKETKAEKAAGRRLRSWPSNALRKAAATYMLAASGNAALTAASLGNSAQVIEVHYKGLVSPAQAAEWWAIFPPGSTEQVSSGDC
jgi:integrase